MLQEIWNDAIIPGLVTIVTALAGILAAYAAQALRAWAAKQNAQWKSAVMEEVARAVENAVAAVNQTFSDDIKVARADGKLTPDEAMTALTRAKAIAIEQLGVDGMKALEKIIGGNAAANILIYNLIEAAVGKAKVKDA